MDMNKKDTFDSLNSDINLYKDALAIVEGILELYKSYFDLKDRDLNNKHFIIDYGVNIIEKYKKQWLDLFDNILVFKNNKSEFMIKEIKAEDFYYIIQGMEEFFLKEYGSFLSSWDLEATTFREKNSNIKKINSYMLEQSNEEILNFNVKYIKEIIVTVRHEVRLELSNAIKEFNRSVSIEKDDLKYFIINEGSMELSIFYDKLTLMREGVLRNFDNLQEKIKVIIEEKLVKKTLEQINKVTKEKIGLIIRRYKEELNKYYISTIDLRKKVIDCSYNNKLITNENLYRRCVTVLEIELTHLKFIRRVGVECLRILEQEAEAVFNNMFNYEFYSALYDVRFVSDFKNLIEAYKIKDDFILGNMVSGLLNDFIYRYHGIILLMLKNRKDRIGKLYIFKPITYMGNFHMYEPSVVVQLQILLNDIYDNYDLKANKNEEIKKVYIDLNKEVEKSVGKFNFALESFEIKGDIKSFFQNEKIIIHRSITSLKGELWTALNSSFISVFNCFNDRVVKSIEQLAGEIKLLESKISYSDY